MLTGKRTNVTRRLVSKSLLHAEIFHQEGRTIHLITTHLQATPPSSKGLSKYRKIRDLQCKVIREYMDIFILGDPKRHHDPILFVGDLNIDSRSLHDSEYKETIQKYFGEFTDLLLKPHLVQPAKGYPSYMQSDDAIFQEQMHGGRFSLSEHNDDLSWKQQIHAVTYGDGPNTIYGHPYEHILTDPSDIGSYQALDHALLRDKTGKLEIHSANVNPLYVKRSARPVSHVSGRQKICISPIDHYGIEIILS